MNQTSPKPVRRNRQMNHELALGSVALLGTGASIAAFALPSAGLLPQLATLLVPLVGAAVAYTFFSRPALAQAEGAAASLRAERDGARELAERLRLELERVEGARGSAEAARQAAEATAAAKAEYLATISKEVRTPLTGVIGMAELLTETQLDDEQAALVGTVRQSAEALQAVLSDVMDFAALESREVELEDAPFDVRQVVEGVLKRHLPEARKKGLELVYDVPPTLMTQSRGDARRVSQMVSVLVGNAVKFTERGEVLVRLASRDRGGNAEIRVDVADTGIGISKDDISKIFDPFVRGNAKASERYGGTGLGLSIATRLARLMGGRVDCRSTPGEGSVFTLSFTHRMRQTARGEVAGPDLSEKRYLIIDDSRSARGVFERQLTHWGAEVVAVESAEDGEDLLWQDTSAGEEFDAVLLDTSLPGSDGVALAAQIGEKVPGIPVILLAHGDPRPASAAVADGVAAAFVEKPMQVDALAAVLTAAAEEGPEKAAAARSNARKANIQTVQTPLSPACIVLADDNVANRILMEKFLADEPMTLIHAPDGVGAVESWADWAPDLILMDVSMPRMDGLEATRRIRDLERSEGLVRVPIIALTAKAMAEDREKCLEAGMDDYVTKPIRKAELKSKITEWTRRRRKSA